MILSRVVNFIGIDAQRTTNHSIVFIIDGRRLICSNNCSKSFKILTIASPSLQDGALSMLAALYKVLS